MAELTLQEQLLGDKFKLLGLIQEKIRQTNSQLKQKLAQKKQQTQQDQSQNNYSLNSLSNFNSNQQNNKQNKKRKQENFDPIEKAKLLMQQKQQNQVQSLNRQQDQGQIQTYIRPGGKVVKVPQPSMNTQTQNTLHDTTTLTTHEKPYASGDNDKVNTTHQENVNQNSTPRHPMQQAVTLNKGVAIDNTRYALDDNGNPRQDQLGQKSEQQSSQFKQKTQQQQDIESKSGSLADPLSFKSEQEFKKLQDTAKQSNNQQIISKQDSAQDPNSHKGKPVNSYSVFVADFPETYMQMDLVNVFSPYDGFVNAHIVKDYNYAYVDFITQSKALQALKDMERKPIYIENKRLWTAQTKFKNLYWSQKQREAQERKRKEIEQDEDYKVFQKKQKQIEEQNKKEYYKQLNEQLKTQQPNDEDRNLVTYEDI